MTTTYMMPYWVSWVTFRTQSAASHWTGEGTIDDPWIIEPADDVWNWFVWGAQRPLHPQSVSLLFEYREQEGGLLTTMTVTTEPVSIPLSSPS